MNDKDKKKYLMTAAAALLGGVYAHQTGQKEQWKMAGFAFLAAVLAWYGIGLMEGGKTPVQEEETKGES